MNPASAQQAALRLLLEEVDPLLGRAEELSQKLSQVREELDADLATLAELVQRSVEAQPALLEAGRKLNGAAARIEAAVHPVLPPSSGALRPVQARSLSWAACAGSALLSALLVSVTWWVAARPVLEQARIGRALQTAWPALDAATRNKLQAAGRFTLGS